MRQSGQGPKSASIYPRAIARSARLKQPDKAIKRPKKLEWTSKTRDDVDARTSLGASATMRIFSHFTVHTVKGASRLPNYLSKKDWKSVLGAKEHKNVKKTGISDVLDSWASAQKKDDLGRMVSALEAVIDKAEQVKAKQKAYPNLVDFLKKTIDAAKAEERKLAPRLAAVDDDDDGDNDGDLGKSLRKIRQLDIGKAWNFVLVPGKPSSGLVVNKKAIKKKQIVQAFEMKGKRGPFFTGKIFGEAGKFVLDLGDDKPPAGLAKAAKNAAKLHAEMGIKVIVRGGGVDLDDDTDIEPADDDVGLGAAQPSQTATVVEVHEQRIAQLAAALDRIAQSTDGKVEGAMDGLIGAAANVRAKIENDEELFDQQRTALLQQLSDLISEANAVTKSGEPDPAAAYPDDAFWTKAARQIVQLDPDKHDTAWKRYMAHYDEINKRLDDDPAMTPEARGKVEATLKRALDHAERALKTATRMGETDIEEDNTELRNRLLALDRKMATIARSDVPQDRHVRAVKLLDALRKAFGKGDIKRVSDNIDGVEQAIDQLLASATQDIQTQRGQEDQAEMHAALMPSMALIKKAAFPAGLIKDQTAVREAIKADTGLRTLIAAGSAVVKDQSPQNVKAVEDSARQLLEDIEQRAAQGQALPSDDESLAMAKEALKRANMARIATEYEALGAPPWDAGQTDLAAELQAQLFFLESAIAKGAPDYKAPALSPGDEGGASGSWWIERVEKGSAGAQDAKKQYIFKPAEREGAVLSGLPPGSGAPREVMAKKLDDFMSGAGFNIGVTPTTLASIDASQLGGDVDPKGGAMLGSMQKLASTHVQLGKSMKKGDIDMALNVDKGSFDNVAVFDMIFANLDRHADNLMVETDEATGINTLIPIDHGSALGDPDVLFANRSSLLPPFNIMANPELPQSQQPLSPEALEALERLDADAMVASMKQARDDIEQRHPSAQGTLDDRSIDAMAARVRFMKEVGGSVPVSTLFEMLAYGAREIGQCAPADVADLAQDLKAQAEARAAAKAATKEATDMFEAIGVSTNSAMIDTLKELGWGWSQDTSGIVGWMENNATLVERILKTRQVNPAVAAEIQRLLPQARQNNPNIENQIAGKLPGEQMQLVTEAAHEDVVRGPGPNDMKSDEVKAEVDTLGGETELKLAGGTFPAAIPQLPFPQGPNADEYELFDYWAERLMILRQWKAFKDAGGMAEFLRLGGQVVRDQRLQDVLLTLFDLKSAERSGSDLLAKTPDDLARDAQGAYDTELQAVDRLIPLMRNRDENQAATVERQAAVADWGDGKAVAATTRLAYLRKKLTGIEADQNKFSADTARRWQALKDGVASESQPVKDAFAQHQARLDAAVDGGIDTFDRNVVRIAFNEAQAIIESAKLGDEAPVTKALAIYTALADQVSDHDGRPWHGALSTPMATWKASLDDFDASTSGQAERQMNDRILAAGKLDAWLNGRDLGTLPQPARDLLDLWCDRIKEWSRLDKIDEGISEMDALLPENV